MTPTHADVIVAGLGAMGSATCLQLATRGASVIGIDQYDPPHPYGSTHGETRITRLAIGEGPEYVPLVRRSHELWRQIERDAGTDLMRRTGGLMLGPPDSGFLAQTRASAREYGIAHEDLTSAEIVRRFPMFRVTRQTEGYYEAEAGYVGPEAAVRVQLELARRRDAQLQFGERVTGWEATDGAVEVRTDARTYTASFLALCLGPWIAELFPPGDELFAVYRQLMYWFPILEHHAKLARMPVFVIDFGGDEDELVHLNGFYGFPAVDGADGGLKVATESYERTTRPDGRQHPASPSEIEAMYRRCVQPHLPWLGGQPLRTVSCLYTSTRGSRFVIDRHPADERVVIVSACSGHGFKHSPAIGEAVAQLLTDGRSEIDLGAFSLARAAASADN